MKGFLYKIYGRKNVNRLDWLIAVICVLIGFGCLWISIGISIANAAPTAIPAFVDILNGFTFKWKTNEMAIANSLLLYAGIAFFIFGVIWLIIKKKPERILGIVAILLALLGLVVLASFLFEYVAGSAVEVVSPVWAYGLLVFILALGVCIGYAALMSFTKYEIFAKVEEAKKEEAAPVKVEEKVVEEPKVEEKVEVKEEPKPVKKIEEPEEAGDEFGELGPRRRHIPFEINLKHCSKETQNHYKEIVKAFREYDLNDRLSIPGETFSFKRNRLLFITLSGKTLKIFFALKLKDFKDSTIPLKDASDVKKYEQTPVYLKVKSDLACRRAIALGKQVLQQNKVHKKA